MRRIRNLSFVVLCVCFLQAATVSLWASCHAPGLAGIGETETEAIEDCEDGSEAYDLCQSLCGLNYEVESMSCTAFCSGSGCTAAGAAECRDAGGK